MTITVKMIEDSIHEGHRISTLELEYPRYIHCFDDQTEVLAQVQGHSPEFMPFKVAHELSAKIAQYTPESEAIEFVEPEGYVERFHEGKMVKYDQDKEKRSPKFSLLVTGEHRMFSLRRTTGNAFLPHTDLASEWVGSFSAVRRIPQAGIYRPAKTVNPYEAALAVWFASDGGWQDKSMCFNFKRKRKVESLQKLLDTLGIGYTSKVWGEYTRLELKESLDWVDDCYNSEGMKRLPDFVFSVAHEDFHIVKDAILDSDGCRVNNEFNNTSEELAEQVQVLCTLHGIAMNIRSYKAPHAAKKRLYKSKMQETNYVSFRPDRTTFSEVDYSGYVYCFSVPSSYLVVRREGVPFVSGNCEFMTHRVFSRNASSSRAIPVQRMIANIKDDPATPMEWGANKSGMQAGATLDKDTAKMADFIWRMAAQSATEYSKALMDLGVHKQWANRITEPFQHIKVLVTSTTWGNFLRLRDHEDAQPEIQELARAIKVALLNSTPKRLQVGDWHSPYVTEEEKLNLKVNCDGFKIPLLSAARCARVSYNNHDGSAPDQAKDIALFERLAVSQPSHSSPLEHVAMPPKLQGEGAGLTGNFTHWWQFRKYFEVHGWGKYDPVGTIDGFM